MIADNVFFEGQQSDRLEQPQTCCEVKPVDEIQILLSGYLDLKQQCINKQTMKTLRISASTTKLRLWLFQPKRAFTTSYFVVFLYSASSVKMRDDCSFCKY
jgi:hypothetical protein